MSYIFKNNKIQDINFQNQKNKNDLENKSAKYKIIAPQDQFLKSPKVIYESDWIQPGIQIDRWIKSPHGEQYNYYNPFITGNQNVYFVYNENTVKKGQEIPFELNYKFFEEIDLDDKYIPYVKETILVKSVVDEENQVSQPATNIKLQGVYNFQKYIYDNDYYEIRSDDFIIYKGYTPEKTFFTDTEKVNGDFSENCASKWFFGTLEYAKYNWATPPLFYGNTKIENKYIVSVDSYWDIVPLPEDNGWNSYKHFSTSAISDINQAFVSGTGTYEEVTAFMEDGSAKNTRTITKNVVKTALLFKGVTIFTLSDNDINNTNSYIFKKEDYQGDLYFAEAEDTECKNLLLQFTFSWLKLKTWKLFFDSQKATLFSFSKVTNQFLILPDKDNYQSAILPYNNIYVKVNQPYYVNGVDRYGQITTTTVQPPIPILNNSLSLIKPETKPNKWLKINTKQDFSSFNETWVKTVPDKHYFKKEGKIILTAPALTELIPLKVNNISEKYIKSGDTYILDEANRVQKDMPLYQPQASDIRIKLVLTVFPPDYSLTEYKN